MKNSNPPFTTTMEPSLNTLHLPNLLRAATMSVKEIQRVSVTGTRVWGLLKDIFISGSSYLIVFLVIDHLDSVRGLLRPGKVGTYFGFFDPGAYSLITFRVTSPSAPKPLPRTTTNWHLGVLIPSVSGTGSVSPIRPLTGTQANTGRRRIGNDVRTSTSRGVWSTRRVVLTLLGER